MCTRAGGVQARRGRCFFLRAKRTRPRRLAKQQRERGERAHHRSPHPVARPASEREHAERTQKRDRGEKKSAARAQIAQHPRGPTPPPPSAAAPTQGLQRGARSQVGWRRRRKAAYSWSRVARWSRGERELGTHDRTQAPLEMGTSASVVPRKILASTRGRAWRCVDHGSRQGGQGQVAQGREVLPGRQGQHPEARARTGRVSAGSLAPALSLVRAAVNTHALAFPFSRSAPRLPVRGADAVEAGRTTH